MAGRSRWHRQDSDYARGEPLGHSALNQMSENVRAIDSCGLVEHQNDGTHNALEIPWLLGKVDYPSTYLFDAAYFASVANPATGEYTLTLQSGVVTEGYAPCIVNVCDAEVANKPHMVSYEYVDATTVKVRIQVLSSTLANESEHVWVSANRDFDVAVHALQQTPDGPTVAGAGEFLRREYLTEDAAGLNTLVTNQGDAYVMASAEHNADGTHAIARVAKAAGFVRITSGPGVSLIGHEGIKAVSRTSAGQYVVQVDDALIFDGSNFCAFVEAFGETDTDLVVAHARPKDANEVYVYVYAYNATTHAWGRDDRPFLITIFGNPA